MLNRGQLLLYVLQLGYFTNGKVHVNKEEEESIYL